VAYNVNKTTMKRFVALALVLAWLAPAIAQTSASFTGKWEGTSAMQRPDATEADAAKAAKAK